MYNDKKALQLKDMNHLNQNKSLALHTATSNSYIHKSYLIAYL